VAGPVRLETPPGVERTDVRSAQEMRDAVLALVPEADLFVGAAAVADYAPAHRADQKIKKDAAKLNLELAPTPDILAEVAALKKRPFTVGFAAETERLKEHALQKLSRKRLDMIAANRVGVDSGGFESEFNEILLLTADGEQNLGSGSKRDLARRLIGAVATRLKDGKSD
jgi:phosphopantothenoylcysteine decarboxylase/phosphopantothenate--cysteine ligase